MPVQDLLNIGTCSLGAFNGTSNDFCLLDIKRIKKILRAPVGFKFPDTFEFTYANLLVEEQKGNIIPIYTLQNAVFTTEENVVQTFGGGTKKLTEKLPIQIDANMINGVQGYQNTLTIEKAGLHSFFIVDMDNTVFGRKGSDELFGGINSEFFQVMDYKGSGDDSANYMIQFQLNRTQFDNDLMGLRDSEYAFDIDDLVGVTNFEITIPVPPSDTDTTLAFKVVRLEDKVAQLGLDDGQIKLYVNGVDSGATITEGVDGNYTASAFSPLSTGDIVTIKTNDGTYDIVNLNDVLFKSNLASTVTTA